MGLRVLGAAWTAVVAGVEGIDIGSFEEVGGGRLWDGIRGGEVLRGTTLAVSLQVVLKRRQKRLEDDGHREVISVRGSRDATITLKELNGHCSFTKPW